MLNMMDVVQRAADRAHQLLCTDGALCAGPSHSEIQFAASVLEAALPAVFADARLQVSALLTSGHLGDSPPDATAVSAEKLLRDWFHWWRTDPDAPTTMPGALHVATIAFLAVQAVQSGRKIYGPADV